MERAKKLKMDKLKKIFTDEVGLNERQEAVELYPTYATEVTLERFITASHCLGLLSNM